MCIRDRYNPQVDTQGDLWTPINVEEGEKPEWFDKLVNMELTEEQIKDLENRVYEYDQAVKEGRRD